MAKVIQVIETEINRGDGKDTVMRGVKQYWSLDGRLLAEVDPYAGKTDRVKDYAETGEPVTGQIFDMPNDLKGFSSWKS